MTAALAPPRTYPPPAAPVPLDLARVVGPAWRALPSAVQRRFAPGHGAVTYRGTLTVRHGSIGWAFARLATSFGRPLPLCAGEAIPATVRVHPDGRGGVVWERWLHAPGRRPERVRSTKRAGADGGVWEHTDGPLGMALDVRVEGAALVFESRRYVLAFGRWRLPLPTLLTPGRCRVTHAAAGPGRFRFTLSMTHPLLGCTASQDGIFHDPEEHQP